MDSFAYAAAVGLAPTLAIVVSHLLSRRKLDGIHTLVNSQMTAALNRIDELEKRLGLQAGAPIPPV